MNHDINLGGTSLAAFLDRIGLPQVSRERVIEIDQELADAIASGDPDANDCADLVLEATDLIADLDPPGFDWKGWADDDDDLGEVDGIEIESIGWG